MSQLYKWLVMCRPLLALIRLGGPCCLLLWFSWGNTWWPLKQRNVIRTKAWSTNGKQLWKTINKNMEVSLGCVLLVNLAWECTKEPYNYALNPVPSQNQELGTSPPWVSALLYLFNNDVTISCPCHHHITMWRFGDVMLFWWESHTHAFRCVNSNPLLRVCLLGQPCSNYLYRVRDSNPGHTLWHSPQKPQHGLTLSLQG